MSRLRSVRALSVALLAALTLAITLGVARADGAAAVESAVVATKATIAVNTLADEILILAGGVLLIGLGIGVAVASGVTYWQQNRQIGGRLE